MDNPDKKSRPEEREGAYARSGHSETVTYKRKEKTRKKKDKIVE